MPECPQADEYRALAQAIDENKKFVIPTPLPMDDLEKLLIDFGLVDGVPGTGPARKSSRLIAGVRTSRGKTDYAR